MGKKAEVGTPKYIANKMKSKGLQKLRWYCQMCEKQCRDENGFKCHTTSESHQRQLLLFADHPGRYLDEFSGEFAKGYIDLLKRQFGTKRVSANKVYQDYISDKNHLHMNATKWVTLTGFVKWLGREGKCTVDETEKGWFVTYIDRDPVTLARQEALARREKVEKDDQERVMDFIEKQVEKDKKEGTSKESTYTELQRKDEDEKIVVALKTKALPVPKALLAPSHALDKRKADDSKDEIKNKKIKDSNGESSKKISVLEEIIKEEQRKKKNQDNKNKDNEKTDHWLYENIIVKVVTKSLGEKYYKKKGYINKVIDRYGGEVVMLDTGDKLKLDQDHLETVIPAIGRNVLVVSGKRRGIRGELLGLKDGGCHVQFKDGEAILEYNEVCKIHGESS